MERKDSIGGTSKRQVLATAGKLREYIQGVRENPPPYVQSKETTAGGVGGGLGAAEEGSPKKKQKN